jgi:glucan phosphoethanolaminetransferase (alkaline phosphatase superfamily)
MDSTTIVIFIIAAFSMGVIVILKRDSLPPGLRRGMAMLSIALIAFAFFLIVYSFFTMGNA